MATREVVYYQAVCDCCGAVCDGDEYSAWNDPEQAIESSGNCGWEQVGDDLLCEDCLIYPMDMEGYNEDTYAGSDDPRRRHAVHGDPDIALTCGVADPDSGAVCILVGVHEIHSASVEDGPDWRNN